jgi:hypothetical protein
MVRNQTAQEQEKRMDELARKYAESHGEDIKAELCELSLRITDMKKRLIVNKWHEVETNGLPKNISPHVFLMPTATPPFVH